MDAGRVWRFWKRDVVQTLKETGGISLEGGGICPRLVKFCGSFGGIWGRFLGVRVRGQDDGP